MDDPVTAIDWLDHFRPAVRAWVAGRDPYAVAGFYSPPWLLPLLLPFALLPDPAGVWALFGVGVLVFGLLGRRFGRSPLGLAPLLLAPPVVHCLMHGNIEWLALAGALLPPRWGLPLLALKPQTTAGLALYWAARAGIEGGLVGLVKFAAPLAVCLAWSGWPAGAVPAPLLDAPWNASLWPGSLLVALPALALAVRVRSPRLALGVSPLLSPYVALHGYSATVLALPGWAAAAAAGWLWWVALR